LSLDRSIDGLRGNRYIRPRLILRRSCSKLLCKFFGTVRNFCFVKGRRVSEFFAVGYRQLLLKMFNLRLMNDGNGASAKSSSRHSCTNNSRVVPGGFCNLIELRASDFVIVTKRYMRRIHQLPECLNIALLQLLERKQGPFIFIDGVFGPFAVGVVCDQVFMLLKLFGCQFTQTAD